MLPIFRSDAATIFVGSFCRYCHATAYARLRFIGIAAITLITRVRHAATTILNTHITEYATPLCRYAIDAFTEAIFLLFH